MSRHAYSLLELAEFDLMELGVTKVVKLFNPWGNDYEEQIIWQAENLCLWRGREEDT